MDPAIDMGPLIRTHRVDTARRRLNALVLLLVGAVVTPIGVVLAVLTDRTPTLGDDVVPWVVLGGGLGLLLVGGLLGWQVLIRRDEAFELHEGGLLHAYGRHRRAVPWEGMAKVADLGNDRLLSRALGGQVNCHIEVAGGKRLAFTALTAGAAELAAAVRHAVEDGVRPQASR
jgi:hypothetical protein